MLGASDLVGVYHQDRGCVSGDLPRQKSRKLVEKRCDSNPPSGQLKLQQLEGERYRSNCSWETRTIKVVAADNHVGSKLESG